MQDLFSFYQNEIEKYTEQLVIVKKQLFTSSMLRLGIFCLAVLGIYLFLGNTKGILAVLLLTIVLFLILVTRHTGLQYKRDKLKLLVKMNETEVKVLNRDFHNLPDGNEFKDPLHYYSQDIDLFGKGSFYQYANRTALQQGSETLAGFLTENTIDNIVEKQEAIQELAIMPEWRQDFSAIAALTKTETSTDTINTWLKNYKPFVPGFMKSIPLIITVASIVVFGLYFMNIVPESILVLWLFVGLGITGIYTKKITKLTAHATKVQSTFDQYNKLLLLIENTDFKSEWLQQIKEQVINESVKTSDSIGKFSKLLNGLDRNNNVLYLIFANGFFLRSLSHCFHIEQWIQEHGSSVKKWFNVISVFDAYNSLGNFAFNHPKYAYPVLTDEKVILKSEAAGHPLLNPDKSVLNDFQINNEQFFIITGANMAGKSTFLRTVSLQLVMANIGLPVCATSAEYAPMKLITSMRTTDSLTDDESYFFSELKRLKFIVDEIQNDRYFIVLDEILKGTNSTDKAIGSRKFVEKLVGSKSTGIIATHDLSLCEAAEELPQIKNHYFDAEIINNELHFDYRFKTGICQNMNASFLLKKMEIVE